MRFLRRTALISLITLLPATLVVAGASPDQSALAPRMDLRFRMATAVPASPGGVRLSLLSHSDGTNQRDPNGVPLGLSRSAWTPFPRGLRPYEISRADCAMKGLGAGATLGLWLGALATATDAWDERTSWCVAGAAAAAGAALGGTIGVSSETWRTNYEWDE